jgi:hypothetical protein
MCERIRSEEITESEPALCRRIPSLVQAVCLSVCGTTWPAGLRKNASLESKLIKLNIMCERIRSEEITVRYH